MTDDQNQPAGWYPQPDGAQRYWDGSQWTEHTQPGPQPAKKKSTLAYVLIPIGACVALLILGGIIGAVGSSDDEPERASTDRSSTTRAATTEQATTNPDAGEAPPGETTTTEAPTTEAPTTAPPPTEPEREQYEGQDLYRVGESDTTDDFTVTVNTIEDPFDNGDFGPPASGSRYVGVEVTLVNNASDAQTYSSFAGTEVKDPDGRAYMPAFAGLDRPQLDGEVGPGGTRRGWVVFEVPNDAAQLVLRIRGSFTATGAVFALY